MKRSSAAPSMATLQAELVALLQENLRALTAAHAAAVEGATHEEAKPENDKDTRAIEASYLARGQAQRIAALKLEIAAVTALSFSALPREKVGPGSLVTVSEEEHAHQFFIAPGGGGTKLAHGTIQVVTPASPLGQALADAEVDDERQVTLAGKTRTFVIEKVR